MTGILNQKMEEDGASVAGWKHVALSKGYMCIRCGNVPEFEEREQYFETKLCGWCLHQTDKEKD